MERECLLSPGRGKGEPEISGITILCPNPAELLRLERLTKKHTVKQLFMYNAKFWQVRVGDVEFYVCGPAVGAPKAINFSSAKTAIGAPTAGPQT